MYRIVKNLTFKIEPEILMTMISEIDMVLYQNLMKKKLPKLIKQFPLFIGPDSGLLNLESDRTAATRL